MRNRTLRPACEALPRRELPAVIVDIDTGLRDAPPPRVALVAHDFAAGTDGIPAAASGHGSLMASIFAGAEATLGRSDTWVSLKASDASGMFTPTAIADAMDYVATTIRRRHPGEAIVVNCSLAGPMSLGGGWAVLAAEQRLARAGVVVVAAAGNDGRDIDAAAYWPASGSSYATAAVLSVAVADDAGRLRDYSNFGPTTVDVAARNQYGTSGATVLGSIAAASVADANPRGWRRGVPYARAVVAAVKASATPNPALAGRVATGGELLDLSPRPPAAVPHGPRHRRPHPIPHHPGGRR